MVADGLCATGLRVLKPLTFDTAKAKQPLVKRLPVYSVYTCSCHGNRAIIHTKDKENSYLDS